MFGKLKKVDNVLFWVVIAAAAGWLLAGALLAEDAIMILLGIIPAALCFLEYYIAGLFYYIGVDKGYDAKVYLWMCTMLTVVGYMLIIAMPDRSDKQQLEANDELPEL